MLLVCTAAGCNDNPDPSLPCPRAVAVAAVLKGQRRVLTSQLVPCLSDLIRFKILQCWGHGGSPAYSCAECVRSLNNNGHFLWVGLEP